MIESVYQRKAYSRSVYTKACACNKSLKT